MYKQKLNQRGFHVFGLLMVLVVVGFIGFVGFRIFNLQRDSTAEGQAQPAASQGAPQPAMVPPPGWKLFADKKAGVQFVYPDVYGIFQEPTKVCCGLTKADFPDFADVQVSNQPSTQYVPGVDGYFVFGSYKNTDALIPSSTFGPKVRLDGDAWTVAASGRTGADTYSLGDTYTEFIRTNARGLNVYTAVWSNEGMVTYKLHFVANGRLHTLQLPPFDSEQYTSTYNINDQGPYDTMFGQIRDSISLY